MTKKHIKRLSSPKTRKIQKKKKKWTVKASPGPHSSEKSVPLKVALRDHLKLSRYGKEAETVINEGRIKIDGKKVKKQNHPVGFMDIITITPTGDNYRAGYDEKGRISFIPISEEQAKYKLGKVREKRKIKNGKTQITLHDGKNLIKEDTSRGDSVKITLPDQEIQKTIEMEKGNQAYIISGKHAGEILEITEVIPGTSQRDPLIELGEITTQKRNVFPIGEKEPELEIGEEN